MASVLPLKRTDRIFKSHQKIVAIFGMQKKSFWERLLAGVRAVTDVDFISHYRAKENGEVRMI
jgi:hypothetical protein